MAAENQPKAKATAKKIIKPLACEVTMRRDFGELQAGEVIAKIEGTKAAAGMSLNQLVDLVRNDFAHVAPEPEPDSEE